MKKIIGIIILEIVIIAYTTIQVEIVKNKPKPIVLGISGNSLVKEKPKPVIRKSTNGGSYRLTHYGADCGACSGITASGVDVRGTIYYNDNQYGTVRIVAMSKSIPMYSIIKIYGYRGTDITAIVLDRGVGNGVIDLLTESEAKSSELGTQQVRMEVLRYGR